MAESVIKCESGIQLNIDLNTTVWNQNRTTAFKQGNMVFVNVFIQGTLGELSTIATGLPSPPAAVQFILKSSLCYVDTDGRLVLSSPGEFGNVYLGGTVCYCVNN